MCEFVFTSAWRRLRNEYTSEKCGAFGVYGEEERYIRVW
jgi:hypothetical protein